MSEFESLGLRGGIWQGIVQRATPPGRLLLVGDVLFKGSIGRTDFPKGDFDTLISSIHGRLWPLGDDVAFISGHGPMSTIGFERRSNPFCGD